MNKKMLAFLIIAGVVIFVLGLTAGILYAVVMNQKTVKFQPAVSVLTTKVMQTAVAYGKVERIEGSSLTLSSMGDSATIKAKDDAQVFYASGGTPQPMKFSDIGVGDMVTMSFNLDPSGKIEADKIFIFTRASN